MGANAFVRGLWHLFIFFAGLLFYGLVLTKLECFPERLGLATFDGKLTTESYPDWAGEED